MTVDEIIEKFESEFSAISDKFEIIRLLNGKRKLDVDIIKNLKLPSVEYNIIWHPGVYVFYGNGSPYRVGRHLENSRLRVLEHLKSRTGNSKANVWDIKNAPDREIILFNVKCISDTHWVAALELFMENELKHFLKIPAQRQG